MSDFDEIMGMGASASLETLGRPFSITTVSGVKNPVGLVIDEGETPTRNNREGSSYSTSILLSFDASQASDWNRGDSVNYNGNEYVIEAKIDEVSGFVTLRARIETQTEKSRNGYRLR